MSTVDGKLDIAIDITAPVSPGRYISFWTMASTSGHKFGRRVWALILVKPLPVEFSSFAMSFPRHIQLILISS